MVCDLAVLPTISRFASTARCFEGLGRVFYLRRERPLRPHYYQKATPIHESLGFESEGPHRLHVSQRRSEQPSKHITALSPRERGITAFFATAVQASHYPDRCRSGASHARRHPRECGRFSSIRGHFPGRRPDSHRGTGALDRGAPQSGAFCGGESSE